MWDIVFLLQNKKSSSQSQDEYEILGEKRKGEEDESSQSQSQVPNIFKRKGVSTQSTINCLFKKDLRESACSKICKFFYANAIPFNVVKSDEFQEMFDDVIRHGHGFKPPSYHEIREKYLKQHVQLTMTDMEKHKAFWKKTGCTIMTDGWTDQRRRTLINFLVNSPKGTVFLKSIDASHISKTAEAIVAMLEEIIKEVGEENVIQVVSDNAANYKAAGRLLMEKRLHLYWTPCAAHCIDLMLEDLEGIPMHKDTIARGRKITTYIYSRTSLICLLQHFTKGKDLVRPGMTRFATSYLTLGCLGENKGPLQRMFTSEKWQSSQCAKSKDGKYIEDVVIDKKFWKDLVNCLRGAFPLIKVLRMVDSDEKPAMGYIYKAKETIRSDLRGVESRYMPLWTIIDSRWDRQLHRPLHAAGYYLNPQLHYGPDFKADFEVMHGLYQCLDRMTTSIEERNHIDKQIEIFKLQEDFFGSSIAQEGLKLKTPAQWWESYGYQHPELQRFAIRILSLTCSSSGCERNWSAFEMVHTKKRNRLKQQKMNDLVYVMANFKLAKKTERKKSVMQEHEFYSIDDLSSDDEWIVENVGSPSNIEDIDDLDMPEFNLDATDEDALMMIPEDDGGSELGGEGGEDIMQHCFGDEDEDEDEGNNEDGDEDDGEEDDYDIPSFH